ncbi:MAG TPA: cytochrome P450 [Pseudonocardiaceae bacterium]|nr:cytochrome P450 [Pseudonocardiaceae bacterium]
MDTRGVRTAARYGIRRAVTEYHAVKGDPAAELLGVRQRPDPFPLYEQIRARGEIYRSPLGFYCTVSHPMVRAVLSDGRFGMSKPTAARDWQTVPGDQRLLVHPVEHSLLAVNPPEQTRLRKLISAWFTAKAVRDRTPRVRQLVQEVLDKLVGRDEFDAVTDIAARVPLEVICDLLGVPIEDHDRFIWWGTVLASTIDGPKTMTERRDIRASLGEMNALFAELVERYRAVPADNLISELVHTSVDGEPFGRRDLLALTQLLFVAGLETTGNLIGDCVRLLLAHPDQKELVFSNPELVPGAIEEVLRFDPPTKYTARLATEEVELAGTTLPRGGFLFELLAGANRDPRVFTDPHVFDITRKNSRENVSFSAGVHHCIGSGLARVEAEVTLRELFARYPRLRPAGPSRIRLARSVRGPYQLPVRA